MTSFGFGSPLSRAWVHVAGPIVAFLLLFPAQVLSAGGLSAEDKTCLACHSSQGLEKKTADGETLSLHVPGKAFADSVHNAIGCAGCHANVDIKSHPPEKSPKIASTRAYAIASVEACRECHGDKFKLYEGSIHASLVAAGNEAAPLCTDCHSPHAVKAKAAPQPITEVACRNCHSDIYKAYAASVHGIARSKPGDGNAPICSDCHRAHDVSAAAHGNQVKDACLACHKDSLAVHRKWLPNSDRHFEAVSCAACHATNAQRRVDLRLYDNVAKERVSEKKGVPQFEIKARSADARGQGLDALALQSLLKEFNREGSEESTTLRGRLEVRTGIEAHQLGGKATAIRECDSCHRHGAEPFQVVTVSIAGSDGRTVRYGAQKEVLSSPTSVESVGGFYAIGGTRIKILDVLLVIALLAGISVPIGHMTLKWLFRTYLRKLESEAPGEIAKIVGKAPAGAPPKD